MAENIDIPIQVNINDEIVERIRKVIAEGLGEANIIGRIEKLEKQVELINLAASTRLMTIQETT